MNALGSVQKNLTTQNSFSANAGNAIDLNGDGVTIASAAGNNCPSSGAANGGIPRPSLVNAALGGTTTLAVSGFFCNSGTYTLELYKAAAGAGDTGSDGKPAGEGVTYLGSITGLTGASGAFTSQAITIPAGALAATDTVTAIAIRTDGASTAGNTSEFSANIGLSPTLLLRETTNGGTGTHAFTVTNADTVLTTLATFDSAASITTTAAATATAFDADTSAAGVQPILITSAGTAVVVTQTVPAGSTLTAASCTNGSTTFTATGLPAAGASSVAVTIPAASVTAGSSWTCDFVNTLTTQPKLRIRKVTTGGVGSFSFTGNNGLPTVAPGIAVATTVAGTAVDSAAQTLAAAGVATQVTEAPDPTWTLTTATCLDNNAATTGNPPSFGSLSGTTLTVPAANVLAGADIVCVFNNSSTGFSISGRVFKDSGTGGGTANDGLQNGGETGIAGVGLALTNCAGSSYTTATTDGAGNYSLAVGSASGTVCVEKTALSGYVSTGANVGGVAANDGASSTIAGTAYTYGRSAGRLQFALAAGTSYPGLNFGDVAANQLLADGSRTGLPGGSVQFAHSFIAATSGNVAFSVAVAPTPAMTGWVPTVYRDVNCDGALDAGDVVLAAASPVAVTEGQTVCLLVNQTVPGGAANGARNDATLTASFSFTNASPALSASYTRRDVTVVSNQALGLAKSVRNVTQGGSFATSNQARSGDVLEYQIVFQNNGATPINNLAVYDATPAYSSFVSAACGSMPAGLTACSASTVPAVGAAGNVRWSFTGALGGGEQGTVLFRVKVD